MLGFKHMGSTEFAKNTLHSIRRNARTNGHEISCNQADALLVRHTLATLLESLAAERKNSTLRWFVSEEVSMQQLSLELTAAMDDCDYKRVILFASVLMLRNEIGDNLESAT